MEFLLLLSGKIVCIGRNESGECFVVCVCVWQWSRNSGGQRGHGSPILVDFDLVKGHFDSVWPPQSDSSSYTTVW